MIVDYIINFISFFPKTNSLLFRYQVLKKPAIIVSEIKYSSVSMANQWQVSLVSQISHTLATPLLHIFLPKTKLCLHLREMRTCPQTNYFKFCSSCSSQLTHTHSSCPRLSLKLKRCAKLSVPPLLTNFSRLKMYFQVFQNMRSWTCPSFDPLNYRSSTVEISH